jgi:two-component system, chemotaxis family, chemotaxis protein CheY
MKRCLVVDDSGVVRKVANRILTSEGFLVFEASSGYEGLALCRTEAPDAVILDATLPDMAPADFVRDALAYESLVKPWIVLCLVELDVPAIMRSKRAGAAGYILKPVNRPRLLKKFREFELESQHRVKPARQAQPMTSTQ